MLDLYSCIFISPQPLEGSGDLLFFTLRPSVCPSVCLSVRLSVKKSCPLYNLITVRDISTNPHTFVKHIQTTCHKNHISLFISKYSPCNITKCIFFCPRRRLNTVEAIWLNLLHFLSRIRQCVMHKNHNSVLGIYGAINFPFGHLQCYFVSAL